MSYVSTYFLFMGIGFNFRTVNILASLQKYINYLMQCHNVFEMTALKL